MDRQKLLFDFVIFGRLSESSLRVAVMILLFYGSAEAAIFFYTAQFLGIEDSLLGSREQNDLLANDFFLTFLAHQT